MKSNSLIQLRLDIYASAVIITFELDSGIVYKVKKGLIRMLRVDKNQVREATLNAI